MRLVLPYPVSANRYWRSYVLPGHARAMVVVSAEAKAFKSQVGWYAKAAGLKPFKHLVELRLRLVPANGVCMDLDNALKVTIDALKGIAYADDSQVWRIVADRGEADGKARMEVEITEFMPNASPLFSLPQQTLAEQLF